MLVGFCGSRSLSPSWSPLVGGAARRVAAFGAAVVVGCAAGADSFVRQACPAASVFSVASGQFGRGRGSFAARSAALVRHVAAAGGVFVGFPGVACPVGVLPARSWQRGAAVSGSWSSLALAAGLGVPVFVGGVPASALPAWPASAWSRVPAGPLVGFWLWSPPPPTLRPSLF